MSEQVQKKVGVREETRRKVEAIAEAKRWTLAETIDAVCDAFMQANGIAVAASNTTRNRDRHSQRNEPRRPPRYTGRA